MAYILRSIKVLSFIFLINCTCSQQLNGQEYDSAIGLSLGTHFAGTYKSFISENRSFEVIAGINQRTEINFIFGGFYEFNHNIPEIDRLFWNYGIGVFGEVGDEFSIAPGAIIGLEYIMEDDPFSFFLTSMPLIYINNKRRFEIELSLGARYILE